MERWNGEGRWSSIPDAQSDSGFRSSMEVVRAPLLLGCEQMERELLKLGYMQGGVLTPSSAICMGSVFMGVRPYGSSAYPELGFPDSAIHGARPTVELGHQGNLIMQGLLLSFNLLRERGARRYLHPRRQYLLRSELDRSALGRRLHAQLGSIPSWMEDGNSAMNAWRRELGLLHALPSAELGPLHALPIAELGLCRKMGRSAHSPCFLYY
ncbi:hypothetical protein Dimus_033742 [Dionaea muscipula]